MRIVAIGTRGLFVALAAAALASSACRSDKPREIAPTTTTGADIELNREPEPLPGAVVPLNGRAVREGTLIELADGGHVEMRNVEIPGNRTNEAVIDMQRENEANRESNRASGATPHDGEPLPEADRSSFERSGGSSGLGIYGQKVPGQERFDTKPTPGVKDGGR